MSTATGGSSSTSVALITPPSDVDYGARVTTILDNRLRGPTIDRYDPTTDSALPTPQETDLVIVTGSSARVHDTDPWIDRLATHLRLLVESETPVLGVCFGHQLLAVSLGGTVAPLEMRAAGFREISTTPPGRGHQLFDGLSDRFTAFLWHRDHVTDLPPGAAVLARNETGIQAFASRNRPAYGIQFHPEVGIADARTLTATRPANTPASSPEYAEVETPGSTETESPECTLTDVAASRATRARRIYENALRAANPRNSRV